jgi:malate dehydrogenase (oxaloacetate-decarboxylating)(NADP+)
LGDLGANGMGIPIGKLVLYSACGGIDPGQCLPVMLDAGTNNERLLNDPLYLGVRERRVEGPAYDAMIEEFIAAAQDVFPGALIQFEDFSNDNAFRLLDRYRQRACVFNDDIQGTGAMALAGLLAAGCVTGRTLSQERVLFVGAGSANIGIGAQLVAAMMRAGLTEQEARERCRFVDSRGLVVASRQDLAEHKRAYARPGPFLADLAQIIEAFRPTTLIGATGKRALFALSNPTRNAECTAEEAYRHTDGRAIFATGSPSPPVEVKGRLRATAQANNAFIFPGLGLGAVACGARRITDDMFVAAAEALAAQVTDDDLGKGLILPPASELRVAATAVARAVAGVAYAQDLASRARATDIGRLIEAQCYLPRYARESSNSRVEAASS